MSPEIIGCVIAGQNSSKITDFPPKEDVFSSFTYMSFVYLLTSIMLQRFKKVVRVDPKILACVMFGQY